jgi:hypothetical protein
MCHGNAQNVPQDGTKRLLNLCATVRHKKTFKTYVPPDRKVDIKDNQLGIKLIPMISTWDQVDPIFPVRAREGTKCAVARHKKTFKTYYLIMCHGKAQNVP